jgi:uncharacterized protein involved in tellurium resistance
VGANSRLASFIKLSSGVDSTNQFWVGIYKKNTIDIDLVCIVFVLKREMKSLRRKLNQCATSVRLAIPNHGAVNSEKIDENKSP